VKYKCPACGYSPNKQDALVETRLLFNNFPKDIQKHLKEIIKVVNKTTYSGQIPVEYKYRFMYGLSVINHDSIRRTIQIWNSGQYGKQGKNLIYFVAIAKNKQETEKAQLKGEQLIRGHNPPDITKSKTNKKDKSKYEKYNKAFNNLKDTKHPPKF
tara:strand:- start:273 stop:740 length:468 start_codon:yes stop_codon:yes gene_type:complete